MELINFISLSVLLFSALYQAAEGLHCYQCDSTLDSTCQERWDDSLAINAQKYKPCQLWDANYCAKVTGMWGGVVGTHRFCTSKDLGDQCQDIWFPDHDRMYRACVFSCDSDGCNSAGRFSLSPVTVMASVLAALLSLVVRLL